MHSTGSHDRNFTLTVVVHYENHRDGHNLWHGLHTLTAVLIHVDRLKILVLWVGKNGDQFSGWVTLNGDGRCSLQADSRSNLVGSIRLALSDYTSICTYVSLLTFSRRQTSPRVTLPSTSNLESNATRLSNFLASLQCCTKLKHKATL